MYEVKVSKMKSHDCHIFMQSLLPIAFRDFLPKQVWEALTEISELFRALCSSTICITDMEIWHPPERKKGETQPCLEETGRELDFSLLFLSKNLIWNPKISPPAGSFRICSVRLLLLPIVGANSLNFR
ncbi:hypothetical protein SLEP1_g54080 [Rubroshorea leprosula]|uniref:Uncharacterized protein n=1 Tax=Rubroshorea leprosula TaxID=152421 RepID=A0AAV5MC88_9ROSI|nr:hypothetical protein SLEP1_g54080 [Rubroshorea leprosula]